MRKLWLVLLVGALLAPMGTPIYAAKKKRASWLSAAPGSNKSQPLVGSWRQYYRDGTPWDRGLHLGPGPAHKFTLWWAYEPDTGKSDELEGAGTYKVSGRTLTLDYPERGYGRRVLLEMSWKFSGKDTLIISGPPNIIGTNTVWKRVRTK